MLTMLDYAVLDPIGPTITTAIVGAIVQVLVERAINRWVPEPRLEKPQEEYILREAL